MRYFHGHNKNNSYFEGWYLKHQIAEQTAAFIPAFHVDENGQRSASLQIITNTCSYNVNYTANDFMAKADTFYVKVGNNIFGSGGCHIDVNTDSIKIFGDIVYGFPKQLKSDIMGPFRFIPRMQCSHGVISMGHKLTGSLNINGRIVDFSGGDGYIETDRGSSFPKNYIWTQCNRFDGINCSIMASVADIPMGPFEFQGCICAVMYDDVEYRMATYNGVKIEDSSDKGLTLTQGDKRLKIKLLKENSFELRSPNNGKMSGLIRESAQCKVRYEFSIGGKQIFDLTGGQASFEAVSANK